MQPSQIVLPLFLSVFIIRVLPRLVMAPLVVVFVLLVRRRASRPVLVIQRRVAVPGGGRLMEAPSAIRIGRIA